MAASSETCKNECVTESTSVTEAVATRILLRIIDFHGLEPIVASDVPYKMIGAKVEISRASTLSEIFDRLNAELEYKKGIITFKVYGAGILSVTMQPASISRLLRR
ncbi:hypothetical protein FOZ62_020327 [Perkinsus olseni]|uniref:Uncharacterized protein n=1 Tax=Perkinsus olseni TaxID=32597 RepID=A0A7J6RHH9_PEROL|nr:hypothetical protein FOZ62_020327 [Perkinsus olseni]